MLLTFSHDQLKPYIWAQDLPNSLALGKICPKKSPIWWYLRGAAHKWGSGRPGKGTLGKLPGHRAVGGHFSVMLWILTFFHLVRCESPVTWKLVVRLPDPIYLGLFMAQLQLEINGCKSAIVGIWSRSSFLLSVFFFPSFCFWGVSASQAQPGSWDLNGVISGSITISSTELSTR